MYEWVTTTTLHPLEYTHINYVYVYDGYVMDESEYLKK